MKVQPISPNMRLIDVNTGTLTREGFTFFQALRAAIAGDDAGAISFEDLEFSSLPKMPVIAPSDDDSFPAQVVVSEYREEEFPQISYAAEIAALKDRIDELEARAYK